MSQTIRGLGKSIANVFPLKSKDFFTKKDLPAIIALSLGIVMSLLTFILVDRLELSDLKHEFLIDTENYSVALGKSIDGNLNSLHAIEGLYASSVKVTRAKFHTFANNILPHSDGIHKLRWVPRVAGAERQRYEAAAIEEGISQYRFSEFNSQKQLTTAGRREEYYPVYFSEPAEKYDAVLGLDLSAKPIGRSFLEKARDTGSAVATRRITLRLESDPQFAFLVIQPIYRNALPHDTIEERRKNLTGFAVGVFRMGDMVNAALKGINLKGIELSLFDEKASPERRLLFSNVSRENSVSDLLTSTKTLNVADRAWTVKFHSTPEYIAAHKTSYSWAVLAAGLVSTLFLAMYLLNVKRHTFEMERSKDTIATVLNSIDASIAIVSSESLNILACNNVFIGETGMNEEEVIGRRCCEIAYKKSLPCDLRCDDCPVTLTTRTGAYAARENVSPGVDREERHIEISAFPVKNDTGNVIQAVIVARDITQRKRAENSRLEEQQVRRMAAERQVVETQLRMLQAQIEPHFLFNTLAHVISLVDKQPQAAKAMLQHFTGYLRQSLRRSREDGSTLAQEVEMLRDYLSIFKMRLGARLDFTIDIPKELLSLPFPSMLLQPLVENAIKHGIEPKEEGGRIDIKATKTDSLLTLTVSDTGLGFSSSMNTPGFGLENVRDRLQALYHVNADLVLEENIPCGMNATIEVPV